MAVYENMSTLVAIACLTVMGGLTGGTAAAVEELIERDVPYRMAADLDDYSKERCRLDIVRPAAVTNLPTVIWFHGGGLTQGNREIPSALRGKEMVIVGPGYRLSPNVKAVSIIQDAAAAVAWTFANIEKHGGSSEKIYLSGHSAGGYLALMVGLDKRLLAEHGVEASRLAGIAPYSAQAITHFVIRGERGIPDTRPVIDEFAPLFHARKDVPPVLLITGDREKELLGRYEENAYLARMMKVAGHMNTTLHELKDTDHIGMVEPAHKVFLAWLDGQLGK